jgi:hypothetical protein
MAHDDGTKRKLDSIVELYHFGVFILYVNLVTNENRTVYLHTPQLVHKGSKSRGTGRKLGNDVKNTICSSARE